MKHVFLYVFSLTALAVGVYAVVENIHALTVHILIFSSAMFGTSALLAIPADAKVAIATVAPYLPFVKHDA